MTDTKPTVFEAFSAVMADVQAVRKTERNSQQNYSFRGIDSVLNAVGPALREHGVIIIPAVEDMQVEKYTTGRNNTQMKNVTVRTRFTVHGPAGDSFSGVALGEASDSSDKAVAKAQSVAYRVFLLQGLTIPTDDPDPDAFTHERNAVDPADEARDDLLAVCNELGIDPNQAVVDFMAATDGGDIRTTADAEAIRALAKRYRTEAAG